MSEQEENHFKLDPEDTSKLTDEIYKDLYDLSIEGMKDYQHSFNSITAKSTTLFGFLITGVFALIGYSYANDLSGIEEYLVHQNLCSFVICLIFLAFNLNTVDFPKIGANLHNYFLDKKNEKGKSPFLLEADQTDIIKLLVRQKFIEKSIYYDKAAGKVLEKLNNRQKAVIAILSLNLLVSALCHFLLSFS